jgi:[NiFe] hydrogenase assembly HybE family chaperone
MKTTEHSFVAGLVKTTMAAPVAGPHAANTHAAARIRVARLEQVFSHIASTRMQGVPVLNPVLHVQAIGFEVLAAEAMPVLQGILITPWFMNLLLLPLVRDAVQSARMPGTKRNHLCGDQLFEFIAGFEDALGSYEACSLFSPMFEFADQSGAVATAAEVLKLLRAPAATDPASEVAAQPMAQKRTSTAQPDAATAPSRRGFLLGRSHPGAAP